MKQVPLKDFAEITTGQGAPQKEDDFDTSGMPFVRAGSLEGLLAGGSEESLERITAEAAKKYRLKLFNAGTVLFAKSGMSATKDRVYKLRQPAYVVSHLAALTPKEKLDPDYLTYFLRFYRPSRLIKDLSYPSIGLSDIERIKVKEVGISQQRVMVNLLRKSESTLEKRRQTIRLADEFLKSTFLEMFGDPESNLKKWPKKKITDVLISSQYGTSKKSNNEEKGYIILGMSNISNNGQIDLTKVGYVDLSEKEFKELKLVPGDIIFNRTNSTELVGKTACWKRDEEVVLASYLIKLKLKSDILPEFFSFLLNTPYYKNIFRQRCKKAVGQSNISPTLLREFEIFIPAISQQQKFAVLVQKVEKYKEKLKQSETQLQNLFNSLMQRAFKGELFND